MTMTDPIADLLTRIRNGIQARHDRVEQLGAGQHFLFIRNERNMGLNATIERALEHATGEFTTTIASDDVMLPTKIEEQVAWLRAHGADGVLSTGYSLLPDGSRRAIAGDGKHASRDSRSTRLSLMTLPSASTWTDGTFSRTSLADVDNSAEITKRAITHDVNLVGGKLVGDTRQGWALFSAMNLVVCSSTSPAPAPRT